MEIVEQIGNFLIPHIEVGAAEDQAVKAKIVVGAAREQAVKAKIAVCVAGDQGIAKAVEPVCSGATDPGLTTSTGSSSNPRSPCD